MFQVFRAVWRDPQLGEDVEKILKGSSSLDMWEPDSIENIYDTRQVDFMVSSDESDKIHHLLALSGVEIETMIEDAGKLMKNEKNRKTKNLPAAEMAFDEYLDYDELEEWLLSISEKYSHLTQIKEVGKTEDGNRSIWGLHIGDNNNDSEKKKIFMGKCIYCILYNNEYCTRLYS